MYVDFESRRQASLSASFLSIFLLILYNAIRIGFEFQWLDSLKALGFILVILNAPVLIAEYLQQPRRRILMDEFFWLAIFFFGCWLLGFFFEKGHLFLIPVGLIVFLYNVRKELPKAGKHSVVTLVGISLLAIWFMISVWGGDFVHPLLLERLAVDQRIHIDTIFHTAISQMIKTYHIPSTGLNGLPFYHYHFGSHMIFAGLSGLLEMHVFNFYQLCYPVFFIPLFFKFIAGTAIAWNEKTGTKFKLDIFFWALLISVFVGIFHYSKILGRAAIELSSLFGSESYAVSVILFFWVVNVILTNIEIDNVGFRLRLVPFVVVLVLVLVLGLTKSSTLFLFDILIIYLFFRLKLYQSWKAWIAYVMVGIISLLCLYITVDRLSGDGEFALFDFYKKFVTLPVVLFVAVYYFWSFLLIFICLILHWSDSDSRIYRVMIESIGVVSIAGAIPGMFFSIDGGSAGFFMNFQMWLATAVLCMVLPKAVPAVKLWWCNIVSERKRKFVKVLAILALIYCVIAVQHNYRKSALIFLKHTYLDRLRMVREPFDIDASISVNDIITGLNATTPRLADSMKRNENYQYFKGLMALDTIPEQVKSESRLLLSDINAFSKIFPCYKYYFLFTGLSGIAVENGFIFENCHGTNYSFEYYKRDAIVVTDRSLYKAYLVNLKDGLVGFNRME
jgi:hypothetical protein